MKLIRICKLASVLAGEAGVTIFHAECCPLGGGMVKDERCWAREHAKRERKGGTGEITDISQAPAVACAYQDTFSRPVPENIHSEDIFYQTN